MQYAASYRALMDNKWARIDAFIVVADTIERH